MICDDTNRNEELAHLKDTFRRNGYPERVVTRNLRSQCNSIPQTGEEEPPTTEIPKLLCLPYLQGTSERIPRVCRKIGVRVQAVFMSNGTLRQLLMKVKSPVPEMRKKDVVYTISCQNCDSQYIRETGRALGRRVTEHKYTVKTRDRKNGLAIHAWNEGNRVNWEGVEVLEYEQNYWKRRAFGAIWIKKTKKN